MLKPDYQGQGILNLMSSIIRARGGRSTHAPLGLLPVEEIGTANNIVLLVIDGLGSDWLLKHSPDGILARHFRGRLTSVFPPTTAAAISTYLTGEPPLHHGLTGWYTYLRELGTVMTVLPGTPRYGGVAYSRAGVDPQQLFVSTPIFDRIETESTCVSPSFIAFSDFNRAHTGRARIVPFEGLEDLFRQTLRVLRPSWLWGRSTSDAQRYVYLYWPQLDMIGHVTGMWSKRALDHLAEIEQALERFVKAAQGTDTTLLICADHGQIDSAPEDEINLADHPRLSDCLLLPLCGEPRAAFCYLRSGREQGFLDYCGDVLGSLVDVIPSRQLVDEGFFGIGERHPDIMDRVGDYCILPRGTRTIRDLLLNEHPHPQIGVHGGLSEDELFVPLSVLKL